MSNKYVVENKNLKYLVVETEYKKELLSWGTLNEATIFTNKALPNYYAKSHKKERAKVLKLWKRRRLPTNFSNC